MDTVQNPWLEAQEQNSMLEKSDTLSSGIENVLLIKKDLIVENDFVKQDHIAAPINDRLTCLHNTRRDLAKVYSQALALDDFEDINELT